MFEKPCCVAGCYQEGTCGRGVNLMRGITGQWWCWPHYKEHLAAGGDVAPVTAPAPLPAPVPTATQSDLWSI